MPNPLRAALKGFLTGEIAPSGRILAYHGSPYTFDRFDFSKMGTGEGAQAYGWGGYFAGEPAVAQTYKRAGRGPDDVGFRGQDVTGSVIRQLAAEHDLAPQAMDMASRIRHSTDFGDYLEQVQALVSEFERKGMVNGRSYPQLKNELALAQKLSPGDFTFNERAPSRLYEVDLPEGPYLDWDKPLGEQFSTPEIREAARLKLDPGMEEWAAPRLAGETLIGPHRGEYAVAPLRKAGLKGIRYLDQGSRSKGDGTSNYVIFNDKDVNIRKMLGLVLAAGGAGALREALREQSVSA